MRRSLYGLMTLVAIAALLATAGCERSSVLRVAKINGGMELQSDISDWGLWVDPTLPDSEQEPELMYVMFCDTTEVELQYVEIGAGLPTWTPYEAIIQKATISYKSTNPEIPQYENAVVTMNQYVMADRENKKTTKFKMVVVPLWWKAKTYGSRVSEPPIYDLVDIVDATIRFSGWDSVSNRTVEATGKLQIEFANFYDDDEKIGR